MKSVIACMLLATVSAPVAFADNQVEALINSGPKTTALPLPDPSHIPLVFGKDIKWTGTADGPKQALLFGSPDKPGIYGLLIKWEPGHYSKPHFHTTDRYAYVVSGTWWVSASDHYDPEKTYPVPAGTYVRDVAKTVHWDGAKDEPVLLMLVGTGPMSTTELPRAK